ncbi:type II toxin-antitoxin system Phd/YefM family antitoxin [Niveispirillum sp. KHB5.9]|uniref:type II toxin-antitoxin system Phd/YefM family antitoxin n=1 Tax=Niveispirillum sp. KHB5.9 TaxID=3400269 RepID=UPI003A897BBE
MTEIGAFEAKTHFSQLLARAGQGEAFTITLRGRPVARLVPATLPDQAQAQAALERLRHRAQALGGKPFDWEGEWKGWRDEGRR